MTVSAPAISGAASALVVPARRAWEDVYELPHDLDAERAALAAVIVDDSRLPAVAAALEPNAFYRHAHRIVFERMLDMAAREIPIDEATLVSELRRRGELEDVGGPIYVGTITRGMPRGANVTAYCQAIAAAARARAVIADLTRSLDEALRGNLDQAVSLASLAGEQHQRSSQCPLVTDADIIARPEQDWLVEGTIPRDSIGAIIAEPETWKTFVAIDLAYGIATGQPCALGNITTAGPVLYVTNEGLAGIGRRMAAQKIARDLVLYEPAGVHVWTEMVDLLSTSSVRQFIAKGIKPLKPIAVVFDTLAKNFTGDENSTADMSALINNVTMIRQQLDRGIVTLVHHMNAGGQRERGNTALRGGCDFVFFMTKVDDVVTLSCSKQKDTEHFQPVTLELVEPLPGVPGRIVRAVGATPLVTSRTDCGDLTEAQRSVLDTLVHVFGAQGATPAEWLDSSKGLSKATFYRARAELVRKGYVTQNGARFSVRIR